MGVKVSICIPCYNNADEVGRLLKSIYSQDFTDFEVNLSDDSTNNETEKLVKDNFPEVNYRHNPKPYGHIFNWNAAIKMSKGEYIKVMFSDDWFTDNTSLGELVSLLDNNPKAMLAFSGSRQVMLDGQDISAMHHVTAEHLSTDYYDRCADDAFIRELKSDYRNLFVGNQIGAPSATIYRRGSTLTLFDEKSNWASDMFLYFDLLEKSPEFAYTTKPLISIGVHEKQYTESFTEKDMRIYNDYKYMYTKYRLHESKKCRDYFLKKFVIKYGQKLNEAKALKIDTASYAKYSVREFIDSVWCFANHRSALFFWAAFVIELLIVIVDKSAYLNPIESWLFRITFALFCIKILTTKYTKKEWLVIMAAGAVASASYFITGRDEVVRAAVFVISCKNIDLKKMLSVILIITGCGAVVLFGLSAFGIFGRFAMTADFGRGGVETRYCFGMGHPNSFSSMLLMMSTAAVYLYIYGRAENNITDKVKRAKISMVILTVYAFNVVCFLFTDSNTSLIVMTAFTFGSLIMVWVNKLRNGCFAYIAGAVIFTAIVLFSAYGAMVGNGTPVMYRLDKILNGRFQYSYIYEAARLENWQLFAAPANEVYFDQGFIRLFYWYGIIIGSAYIGANLFLIRQAYKRKDYILLIIVLAYGLFTIMEAHLISVYLLRNYLLVWLGYYWYQGICEGK